MRGERLGNRFPKWLWLEHLARYYFASNFVEGKVVVDCACGCGIGSRIFLERKCLKLKAFDVSGKAIEKAKKNCKDFSNAEFLVSDATSLPVEDGSADVFISLETIEHIWEDNKFIREIARILKEDGNFICSTPNREISNPNSRLNDKPWNEFHVREYGESDFRLVLERYFEAVDIYGLNRISDLEARLLKSVIRKIIGGYLWANLIKFFKIFLDKIDNYKIERINGSMRYEYLIAVCKRPIR